MDSSNGERHGLDRERAPYWLAAHVFVCCINDQVVLLDLKRDKYLALGSTHAELQGMVVGWPSGSSSDSTNNKRTPNKKLAEVLREKGLLTADQNTGKAATPVQTVNPSESLAHCFFTDRPPINSLHFLIFLWASVSAAFGLRLRPIEKVVARMRDAPSSHISTETEARIARLRELVGVYEGLRPLGFAGRDSCLYDSLTLMKFLARYGLRPRWIFGVRTAPFGAHCWLQHEEIILNDTPDRTSVFTPIMIV